MGLEEQGTSVGCDKEAGGRRGWPAAEERGPGLLSLTSSVFITTEHAADIIAF